MQTEMSAYNISGVDKSKSVQNTNGSKGNLLLRAWYYLTAPSEPSVNANFEAHEIFRRGRLASLALLFLLLIVVLFMASIGMTSNLVWAVYLSSWAGIIVLGITAAILNRRGQTVTVAVIMIVIIDGGLATDLLTVKGGIGLVNLPLFDLMIASEIIAVVLLAPFSVFVAALLNSVLTIAILLFDPHKTQDLKEYLNMAGLAVVLVRPILLQIAVSLVTFLWANSTLKALKRADRAEAIATLERTIAEYERIEAAKKRGLEHSIQYLIETQRRVANGDIAARVPIAEDNMLWPVAISFNNLLTRYQRLNEDAEHLQQVRHEINRMVQAVHLAKRTHSSIKLSRGGTELDDLILEFTS